MRDQEDINRTYLRNLDVLLRGLPDPADPPLELLIPQIGGWAEATFSAHTDDEILEHMQLLAAEARATGSGFDVGRLSRKAAGIFVLLATLTERNGINLPASVLAEYRRNLMSEWAFDRTTGLVRRKKAAAGG